MITTIDKAGRVVIPKAFRERYHLGKGHHIEVVAEADGLKIRLAVTQSTFVQKQGILVQSATTQTDMDVAAFINDQRDTRACALALSPSSE